MRELSRKRNELTYLLLAGLGHISFVAQFFLFGYEYIIVGLFLGLVLHNLCISLYMHRTLAHNAFQVSNVSHYILSFLYSLLNVGSAAMSAAVHVNHHKFSDTDKDPHDHKNIGVLNVILKRWGGRYKPNRKVLVRLLRNDIIRRQHTNHLSVAMLSVIFTPFLVVSGFWFSNMLILLVHLGRDPNQSATNAWWLFPVAWGEEMHLLHHQKPGRKKMHNFDLIYYFGKLMHRPY